MRKQGDVKFAEVLEMMGASLTWETNAMTVSRDMATPLKGVDVDCGEIPDAAMTLAVSPLFWDDLDRVTRSGGVIFFLFVLPSLLLLFSVVVAGVRLFCKFLALPLVRRRSAFSIS